MKFSLAALTSLLGVASALQPRRNKGVRSSVLRKAIPAHRDGTVRQLNDGQQNEIQITSDQSISFYHCVSLTVYDEQIYENYYALNQLKAGNVIPQESYVLFQINDAQDDQDQSNYQAYQNKYANNNNNNNNYQSKYANNQGYYQNGGNGGGQYQYQAQNNNGGYSSSYSSSSSSSFDDSNLYMLPLQDWMEATGELERQKEELDEQYCQACLESVNTCKALGYSVYGNNGGNRRELEALKAISGQGTVRKLEGGQCYENVECDTCISKGCFQWNQDGNNNNNNNGNGNGYWKDGVWTYYCQEPEQNENGNYNNYQYQQYNSDCEYSEEQVEEFVGEAACFETGLVEYSSYGDEINLKAGLMCSSDGKGIAMAIFLDDECSLYDKSRTFKDTVGEDSYYYGLANSAYSMMVTPMKESISCSACEYQAVGYDGYEENQQQNQNNYNQYNNNNYNQQQEEEQEEVSEFCRRITEESMDLVTCRGEMYNRYQNNQNGNYNGYQNNQQGDGENADGQNYGQYQYSYDVAEGEDEGAACLVVADANGDYSNFHNFYSPKSSGGGGGATSKTAEWISSGMKSEKIRKIAGIIALVLLFVLGSILGYCCCGGSSKSRAAGKAEPLVDATGDEPQAGTMA